ncbi:MAG: WYL domain-containing protein [Oscillospiraceae bacterium]|nr:WYL domain-containing protein [Oscillospiraceae bacterium]
MDYKSDKSYRLLKMREMLERGEVLRRDALVSDFGVTPKTVQRDIASLRLYLDATGGGELRYDRKRDVYLLSRPSDDFDAREIFALCKILTESRAFNKSEFETIVGKLLRHTPSEARLRVRRLIDNECVYYLPLAHGKPLIGLLWDMGQLIAEQKTARIIYARQDGVRREHTVEPVGILFSEFYFYLIAYIVGGEKDSYTVFRADRIEKLMDTDERFSVPYADRFSEAEFRKRVQFMYSGALRTAQFVYRGPNIEAVWDRLPTAHAIGERDGAVLVSAEVYGSGIDMWLRSQGDWAEVVR